MRGNHRGVLAGLLVLACWALDAQAWAAAPAPRLAVVLVVDQLGWEALERLRPKLGRGGVQRLLSEGAVFSAAHYTHAATYTGPGHACIATGSYADRNGIVSNNFYDRAAGKSFTMLADPEHRHLEGPADPEDDTSPRALIGETVGDRLKLSTESKSKVVAIAHKDRAAVLLGGRLGTAYWWSEAAGGMTSSSWYMAALPDWVKRFNQAHAAAAKADAASVELEFIKQAVTAEQLGARGPTDLLAVSFTANDLVGHKFGPESREAQDAAVRTDRQVADLLAFLERHVGGRQHLVVVFTSDHGAAPTPEPLASAGYAAGRIKNAALKDALNAALGERFGKGAWVLALHDPAVYLDERLARERRADFAEVQKVAAHAALSVPGIAAAFTRAQLVDGPLPQTPFARAVQRSFHPSRSGDLMLVPQPFFFWGKFADKLQGSTHGTPYSYDTHVPLIFWGQGVRRGEHRAPVDLADLAPTLAALLGLSPPAAAEGQVRPEVFESP